LETVEKKEEEEPEFEKEDIPDSEEDLSPVKGKMPVEELIINTPVIKRDEEKKRSPPVEKPHQEEKRPKKMRRVEFEDSESEKENSPPSRKIRKNKMDLSNTYNFPTGEKKLKRMFKAATQLNTGGQMRKPNGSVFGLFK